MRIERIDHVHVEVADREEAAEWFGAVLDLEPARDLAGWADHPMGPLILATPDGLPVLSLFARDCRPASRDSTIAFRVSAEGFMTFLTRVDTLKLMHSDGRRLTRDDVVDHDMAWSIYFLDPWGNRFEITTYDYAVLDEQ